MKKNWIVFFGSIAFFIVGAICIIILKLLFGEHYIDAMAVLLIFANVCFIIKRGGVALIHSFLVFVFWLLYNATRG